MRLIRPARAIDPAAFAALFEQYKDLVYRTAYLMLGNAEDAEDALQEVFVLVHKGFHSFDPRKGALATWLYRITVNHCVNHRRKRSSIGQPLEDALALSSGEFLGESLAEEERIRQALGALSAKQRAVVVLRYYADLPYAEISRILDIPLGTVKSRLDLALTTLRRTLEAEEKELEPVSSPGLEVHR